MQRDTRGLALGIIGIALVGARAARADEPYLAKLPKIKNEQAHDHVRKGNALYRSHELEKALDEYKLALAIESAAIILYDIGQCDRGLERWDDEIWVFRRFLDQAKPEPALAERVEAFIQAAEQARSARKAAAPKQVATEPARTSEPGAIAGPPATTSGAASTVQSAPTTSPRMRWVPGEPWYRDPLAWTVTGAGVVGLGVGAGLLVNGSHLDNQANATTNEMQRNQLHARASTRQTAGYLTGGLGAAATIAGIAMLIVHPGDHEEPMAASWRIGVAPRGFVLAGKF